MPAPRFHPFWRLLLCVLGVLAATILVFSIMNAALIASAQLSNRDAVDEAARFWGESKNLLLATALSYPLILLVLIVCRHTLDGRSVSSLGLRADGNLSFRPLAVRSFFGGAACGALAISFLFGLLWTTRSVRIEGFSPETFSGGALFALVMLLLYGALFFAVGFMEEILFRGYALHNLAAWLGIPLAIGIQAVVFAFAHANNGQSAPTMQSLLDARWAMLNIALVGWFFALAYLKTGTLWFPIGFHVAWNWFLGCIWSLPVSGIQVFRLLDVTASEDSTLSGGGFGAEGSILLVPILAAMIWVLHSLPNHPQATRDLASLTTPTELQSVEELPPTEEPEDPNRPRLFKTSMRAGAAPEIQGPELETLARELENSRRAALSAAQPSISTASPNAAPEPHDLAPNQSNVEPVPRITIPASEEKTAEIESSDVPVVEQAVVEPVDVETPIIEAPRPQPKKPRW
ncbi:MAG TPA: CPBP family intramembrane glutamic endopeptidase [Abditibacteriaceae bacterium]|jgi:hypothetical protein